MSQSSISNPLEKYFRTNKARRIIKWDHYFDIYHQYFAKYRGKPVVIVEFGVAHGGSLQMWKHYFGKTARVIGVDINSRCRDLAEDQIEIQIGDQGSKSFLKKLIKITGAPDIVIDDGGHFMKQQVTTFEVMFPTLNRDGIYVTEDVHTSYDKGFGGGYKHHGTFIEYSKQLIDQIQAWNSQDRHLRVNRITRTLKSIHIYNSLIVFEKGEVRRSRPVEAGSPLEGWQ